MADRVTTRVLVNTPQQYAVHIVNVSDGTGETDVTKVTRANVGNALDGAVPDALELEKAFGTVSGFTNVFLEWDHATDDLLMAVGPGSFYFDPTFEGAISGFSKGGGDSDPRSAGGTGDILLTTTGAVSGATYDLTLLFRKNTV